MTKKEIKKRMEAHVNESLAIRKLIIEYLAKEDCDCKKTTECCDECKDIIMSCGFDVLKEIVDTVLPNDTKKIVELEEGEMFYNPDGNEKLQFVELEKIKNGSLVVVDAISYDNELKSFLFNSDRVVEIA